MPPELFGWADDVTTYDYDPDRAQGAHRRVRRDGPDAAVLVPDGRLPAVHAEPAGQLRADQGRPGGRRFHHRAEHGAVEPELPRRNADRRDRRCSCWGGPATSATRTTSSGRSSRTSTRSSAASRTRRSSPSSTRPRRRPTRTGAPELYQEANRLIMDFLPGVPYVHNEPAVAFAAGIEGFEPGPCTNESFAPVTVPSS